MKLHKAFFGFLIIFILFSCSDKNEISKQFEINANYQLVSSPILVIDFGVITKEDTKKTEIKLINNSDKKLYIEKKKTSCGCATLKLPEFIDKSSESVATVEFNPKGKSGKEEQKVDFSIKADKEYLLSVVFKSNIALDIQYAPSMLVFPNNSEIKISKKVQIKRAKHEPLIVENITMPMNFGCSLKVGDKLKTGDIINVSKNEYHHTDFDLPEELFLIINFKNGEDIRIKIVNDKNVDLFRLEPPVLHFVVLDDVDFNASQKKLLNIEPLIENINKSEFSIFIDDPAIKVTGIKTDKSLDKNIKYLFTLDTTKITNTKRIPFSIKYKDYLVKKMLFITKATK